MTRTRRHGRLSRFAGLFASLATLALLTSSCFKIDVGIHVNEDGSGTVSVLVAIDQTAFDQISKSFSDSSATRTPKPPNSTGNEIFDGIDKTTLPPGAKVEAYSEGKFKGATITAPFKSGDDIDALIERLGSSTKTPGTDSSGSSSKVFDKFSLAKEGASWVFDATVPAPQGSDSSSNDLITPEELKALFKDASFVVRLKLPGHVTSDNADKHTNGELLWKLDLFAKDARHLSATSQPGAGGGSGFPTLPVVGGGLLLVVIVGMVVVLMTRRRGPGVATAGGPPPPASPNGRPSAPAAPAAPPEPPDRPPANPPVD